MALPRATARRIVWAVDPFSEEIELLRQTGRAVRQLATEWGGAEVEPVYLMGDFPPNVRLLPTLVRDVREKADAELRRCLRGLPIPRMRPVRVLEGSSAQLREEVDSLIAHARESRADVIAVGTRARKGPRRWFLGSFAETLVLRSDVPLYVINPSESQPRGIKHILFPTDFSQESKKAWVRVIELARELGAAVTIFHKVYYEMAPALEVAFSAYPAYKGLFQQELELRQSEAESWASQARAAGVEAEVEIDYRMEGQIVQSILRAARSRGGIIAVAARSGPVASAFLGSVTRQLVRSSVCPVWVMHPPAEAESKPKPKAKA